MLTLRIMPSLFWGLIFNILNELNEIIKRIVLALTTKNRCAHKEQFLLFDLFRHFIKARVVSTPKDLFSFMCWQHVLSYHQMQVPWMNMFINLLTALTLSGQKSFIVKLFLLRNNKDDGCKKSRIPKSRFCSIILGYMFHMRGVFTLSGPRFFRYHFSFLNIFQKFLQKLTPIALFTLFWYRTIHMWKNLKIFFMTS